MLLEWILHPRTRLLAHLELIGMVAGFRPYEGCNSVYHVICTSAGRKAHLFWTALLAIA